MGKPSGAPEVKVPHDAVNGLLLLLLGRLLGCGLPPALWLLNSPAVAPVPAALAAATELVSSCEGNEGVGVAGGVDHDCASSGVDAPNNRTGFGGSCDVTGLAC